MYLSQLILDPRGAQTRRDLGDPYELHRTLTRAFAPRADEKPLRFLWRLEASGNNAARPRVLTQSDSPGDWGVLQALPNYLDAREGLKSKTVSLDKLLIRDGIYRFRLAANPTIKRNGKRLGLASEVEQLNWLQRQGGRHGFEINQTLVAEDEHLIVNRAQQTPITLRRVRLEGQLRVTDTNRLACALTSGIGPAKAFGCGLLSIAPAQR
jgi:CRISPR system Cascade subunit CasE